MIDLKSVSSEIREIISERQKSLGLVFEEDNHIYTMGGRQDYPSVSKILKKFYREFPLDEAALRKSGGDPEEAGDAMIKAGEQYIKLMEDRGAVLLDTEMVLGDPELGYVGQPDKVWIIPNRQKTEFGLVITDWKTNKPKNFVETGYTDRMYEPFQKYPNTALGHYYLQLPFYGKLLVKMLQGTKYENLKLYGCVISHLKEDSVYDEYKVPQEVIDIIMGMDMKKYLKK